MKSMRCSGSVMRWRATRGAKIVLECNGCTAFRILDWSQGQRTAVHLMRASFLPSQKDALRGYFSPAHCFAGEVEGFAAVRAPQQFAEIVAALMNGGNGNAHGNARFDKQRFAQLQT